MAVRKVVRFVDDLDGGEAVETVLFGLDGVGYELDLSAANAAALRAVLGPYVEVGRPTGRVVAGSANRVRRAIARANRPVPPRAGLAAAESAVAAAPHRPGTPADRPPPEPPPEAQPEPAAVAAEVAAEVVGVQFSDRPVR